ncbi:protein kinase [Streptomyces sp. PKU-EA00015]|uniref:protein kinase domain-containing protein n=1 Tax=Streptomyces sp. PKU-EA00015 TaxID=2748326 RepID=UPI002811CD12|nr:protein kinase [Streptomyces sp. PKU-EA00015]
MSGSGAKPLEPSDPRRIGSFALLGVLGSGGMGRVYLGTAAGRYAAVKQVLPALAEDHDFLRHFGHELDNLARLPAGVSARLLASDRVVQPPWFATEYIPGITLSEALRLHGGPLPVDSLWRLLRDAADGLRAVHAADMVHRDLKPSNVMLTLDGLTLIDFGVARAADQSRLTRTGMVIGTPAYMAPEQAVADRRLSPAADVFALGSLLLYAANGRPPFGDGSGPDLLYRIVHTDADLGRLPDTDPELSAVVESCLAKDPSQRPTAAELFDRARGHVPAATTSPWPPAVMDRITERAAFAANPPPAVGPEPKSPGPETPRPARGPGSTEPDTPPAEAAGPASRKPRERRTRVLFLAVPVVVVVGTTLTLVLGPFDGSSEGAGPGPSAPTAVVPPSESAAGGRSPKPTPPSSRPPGSQPGSSSSPASPGTPGGGGDDDTGDAGAGNAAGGSTGSDGSGSGGSSGSGDSGSGDGDKPPAQPAPSGTHLLRGASTGRCLADSYSAYSGSSVSNSVCGAPSGNGTTMSYRWTYTSVSGGTFRLVSQGTGRCIESRSYAGIAIVECNGSEAQAWQVTATKPNGHTLQNVADKTCLAMSSSIGFESTSCNPSQTAQLWRNS